ncbi:MAG: beta-ketoacyl synthase N-terminal-like domain-containing protein [Cyclobacteriaceae bacterium]
MNAQLSLQQTPVAIIGMSGLFAGAENLDAFWENIVAQADCITEVPPSRWKVDDYYDPDPQKPDKTYSKVGGFIPDIDFDPMEYGLPPNILEVTDSSQILSLVMTKQALQDAHYGGDRFTKALRRNTGVILGVGGGQQLMGPLINRLQYPIWRKVLAQYGLSEEAVEEATEKMKSAYVSWQENAFPGFLSNVISGRIANRFDLGGTNCVVDAACAASLSAIKMSIAELVEHRCDMMITGGVDTDNSPMAYLSFSKTPAFSKKNRVRPFDAEADGIVIGEGIGMLVMKRLADAERDGDTIYAVIKGIGSSSDGRNSSIYGPVSEGQQLAMQRAYEEAGYTPDTVRLIEAHGTGTPTGDRVEFHSIASVFKGADKKIALGSVKSQIGHTKTAAGAASLIKTSLALHHKVLPPTINVKQPNPDFNIAASPVYINTQLSPWIQSETGAPRRASVSAFGFGGTNFHLTLEEYQPEHQKPYRRWSPFRTVVLHAPDHAALIQQCQQVLSETQSHNAFEPLPVPSSIPQPSPRLGFVYQNKAELIERLTTSLQLLRKSNPQKAWEHPQGISYSPEGLAQDSKVAVLFSGQGSQYVNMGSSLACLYPEFRTSFQRADRIMQSMYQETVSDKAYPNPDFDEESPQKQQQELTKTQYAQPAIGAMSISLYNLLTHTGFQPDMFGGHSFGELTALWAAGVLKEEDYLKLACLRGQVMAQAAKSADAGGMLAVQADVDTVVKIISEHQLNLDISNINAPDQVVLGGSTADVERAAAVFTSHKLYAKVLPVSAAFHTLRLKDAQLPLVEAIEHTHFLNPQRAVFSNINGQAYPSEGRGIQEKFKKHMLSTVQFQQQIEAMYQAGARVFVEVGPRNIISNLVQSTLRDRSFKAISLNANPKQDSAQLYQQALTQLLVAGISLDAQDIYQIAPEQQQIATKPKMNVRINASNYVSEKTKKHWEQAMQASPAKMIEPHKEKIQTMKLTEQPPLASNGNGHKPQEAAALSNLPEATYSVHASLQTVQKQIDLMEEMLQFHVEQQKALKKHQTLLKQYEVQINHLFSEEHPYKDAIKIPIKVAVPELAESMTALVSNGNGHSVLNGSGHHGSGHHTSTSNGHDTTWGSSLEKEKISSNGHQPPVQSNGHTPSEPIEEPASVSPAKLSTKEEAPAPVVLSKPAMSPKKNAVLEKAVFSLVADKTGYPAEMLSSDMELVADLGIDSIKQVEIFGSMREEYPILQQWQTEEFIQIKTLGDIIAKIHEHLDPSMAAVAMAALDSPPVHTSEKEKAEEEEITNDESQDQIPEIVTSEVPAPMEQPPSEPTLTLEASEVSEALLAVIADKTGYPSEMLSPEMELVSDLGIDSIKQVEIMGAMREQYPALHGVEPEQLIALKTIGDVTELIQNGEKKK